MKPDKFIKWLERRIDEVTTVRNTHDFEKVPSMVIGKGGQLKAYKEVLHFIKPMI